MSRMPGPRSETVITSDCGGVTVMSKAMVPPPAVAEGIAHDLGDGRADAGLLVQIEPDRGGDEPRALTGRHDVLFVTDVVRQNPQRLCSHRVACFNTTTPTSSRPRVKLRASTAAISDGWRAVKPGSLSNDHCDCSPSECMISSDSGVQRYWNG